MKQNKNVGSIHQHHDLMTQPAHKKRLSFMKGIKYCTWGLMVLVVLTLSSCSNRKKEEKDQSVKREFIITEIMAANHTGLMAKDGELYDWIEIKNISNETVSLKGYSLTFEKRKSKDDGEGEQAHEGASKIKVWKFPDVKVKPGNYTIVFASKKGGYKEGELHADFKLSASGGKLQLRNKDVVVSEICYDKMEDDMSYRLTSDSTFEASYEQTPGFDNTAEGYESYCTLMEQQRPDALKIWEVCSKGYKEGNAWIEVKNVSDEPVNLEDYSLTTSKKKATQWDFPSVQIQPGKTYVIDCKKGKFKIGSTKSVVLTKNKTFVDGVCPAATPYGVSVGRVEGKNGFFYFPSPTRGAENTSTHYRHIAQQPSFDPMPNVYSGKDKMTVHLVTQGRTAHYTTDGSEPTMASPVYKDYIRITKTTHIRAFCEGDAATMSSSTAAATFILDQEHTLPVMNITVPESDLYDYNSGIYVEGPGASPDYPHHGANYWKDWWKKAHVEFFDTINGGFSTGCEVAIFGGFSRALSKKSFKIRFKDKYGTAHLDYDLYNKGEKEEVKNFVLRSGSQDISGVMVRDEFFTSLMKQHSPTLLVQAYRPVALYINGEYFGLYYLREKIDKHFVSRHLDVSSDNISIIMSGMYCEEGSKKDFTDLLNYATTHNLAEKECYEYVSDHIDLVGLIDYKLGQMYSSYTDLGNVRYVQSKDPQSDQKWHIVFYDLDATWAHNAPAADYLSANCDATVKRIQNTLIQELLKNQEFRQLFLQRLSLHMHETFTTENATAVFDNIINTIKPEMRRNCERWPGVLSYASWEKKVNAFREKFKVRNKIMLDSLREWLSITDEENEKYFSDLGF